MTSFSSKYTLATIAGAVLLTACAGAGSSSLTPGNTALGRPYAGGIARSWMTPNVGKDWPGLIYVSDSATNDVYVFSLSHLKLVGTLTDQNNPAGLCVDRKGDVFVTQLYGHQIVEYKHGGTKPIKTLSDPGYEPGAWSVNRYTGDLAVANVVSDEFAQGNVVVYPRASGNPTIYSPPGGSSGGWFSVNGVGWTYATTESDLYFAGTCSGVFCAGVLPDGSSNTENITLSVSPQSPGTVQFDGEDITFADQSDGTIYRYKFNGTSGTEVGSFTLSGSSDVNASWIMWIAFKKHKEIVVDVAAPQQNGGDLLFYNYESHSEPFRTLTGLTEPFGAVLSGRGNSTF